MRGKSSFFVYLFLIYDITVLVLAIYSHFFRTQLCANDLSEVNRTFWQAYGQFSRNEEVVYVLLCSH